MVDISYNYGRHVTVELWKIYSKIYGMLVFMIIYGRDLL